MRGLSDSRFTAVLSHPLLTPDQEISLGRQVQAMMRLHAIRQALQDQTGAVEVSKDEWAAEAGMTRLELQRALRLGLSARDKLVRCNMRLVASLAAPLQTRCRTCDIHDLVSMGAIGLIRAAEGFDPARGYRFTTYATGWIRQSIARGIVATDRPVRIPDVPTGAIYAMKREASMAAARGEVVSLEEAWHRLGNRKPGIDSIREAIQAWNVGSLDWQPNGSTSPLLDTIASSDPEDEAEYQYLGGYSRATVHSAIEQLSPDHAQSLIRFFGIDGKGGATAAEIAAETGASARVVSQQIRFAIKRLRQSLTSTPSQAVS